MITTLKTHWRRAMLAIVLLVFAAPLTACSDDPTPIAAEPTWQVPGKALAAALLSVHGTAATDVWAVGADAGKTGNVLHWDGKAWTRIETAQAYPMWWVHAFATNDVLVGGSGATILHWDGKAFARMKTPGVAAQTVYGIWGATSADVWAVGGTAGHAGFLWHFDGKAWSDAGLPDSVTLNDAGMLPSLFKVWGRSASDVYAVGSDGLMLHFDGAAWSKIATDTKELLFTVAGSKNQLVAVGGSAKGVVLDQNGKLVGPATVPLLQGVAVAPDGSVWACGLGGQVLRRSGNSWKPVAITEEDMPQSLHALWVDPDGGVWTVGGNVLAATLDKGWLFYRGKQKVPALPALPLPEPATTTCPADHVDLMPTASMARRWNELLIDSVRRDIPRPGVHARNLYHVSLAMHDAWAAFEPARKGVVFTEKAAADAKPADRDKAIAYAALRVLTHRYQAAVGGKISTDCYQNFMKVLALDPNDTTATGTTAVAIGNKVGQAVVDAFANDGANEANNYADTTGYKASSPPLVVDQPGTPVGDPNIWQELNLAVAVTQNGIILDAGQQKYICSNWGFIKTFAAPAADAKGIVHDWPSVPKTSAPEMKQWLAEVIRKTAQLDHADGATIDISPSAFGNNPLGTNDGKGRAQNPATSKPYAANVVPRGDFTRVLAEFWADGPKSETPPGHWFVLANRASDDMQAGKQPLIPFGKGEAVDRLQWDVQLYLTLGGAVHDAAITAWGIKRAYLPPRPITLIRYMAGKGQASDPQKPSYSQDGLALEDGLIELITDASSAPGQRHHHLRQYKGQVAVRSWLGEPGDRKNETGPIGWMRGVDWLPYQRRNFVTPAFPGFISGHSTFSRSAAEVLAAYTGSEFFPGGLGEFATKAGNYLVFEDGPSVDVTLQWATYFDAADQAGQSRIHGGIHIWPDDSVGRQLGAVVGLDAIAKAKNLFAAKP